MNYKIPKSLVRVILKWLSKTYLLTRRPRVIVIAGTTSRFWVKEKVEEGLKGKGFKVRANKKNFNAEIGVPLSILDLPSGEGDFYKWRSSIWTGFRRIFTASSVDFLVLEVAVDHPDDMRYILSIMKPNVVILTTITMIYQENFEDLDNIQAEYKTLVEALPEDGVLVLNNDDERVSGLAKGYKGKIVSYGVEKNADFTAFDIKKIVDGQEFSIDEKGKKYKKKISRFGKHHVAAELVKSAIEREF